MPRPSIGGIFCSEDGPQAGAVMLARHPPGYTRSADKYISKRPTSYVALPDRLAKFNSVSGTNAGEFHRKRLGQARVVLPEGPSFADVSY